MLFNSFAYLIFFPIVTFFYFLLPKKLRLLWLLATSLFFYACWKVEYLGLILFSILVTYFCGIMLRAIREKGGEQKRIARLSKLTLTLSLIVNFAILFFFKYFNFMAVSVNALLTREVIPLLDVLLPVGISFYTFQAVGYTIDVYRGSIEAERNIVKYATFVSFFPQLVAGPIERASNLLPQFSDLKDFNYDEAHMGLVQIGWGLFCKLVIADRLALFINPVFQDYQSHSGYMLAIAAMLFAIQLYCDFASYSIIAIGSARVLGFKLMRNFNAPYLSTSIADFWSNWHISLSTWLRDYLYIPLGGNRKGTTRRLINLLIVFFVSGIWHGANWTFLVWGLINGFYQVSSYITGPVRAGIRARLGVRENGTLYKTFCRIVVFLLYTFSLVFFRAQNLSSALEILRRIFTGLELRLFSFQTLFAAGLDVKDGVVALCAILILGLVDIYSRKTDVVKALTAKPLVLRWALYLVLIAVIAVFGIYGPAYDAVPFIYFQF